MRNGSSGICAICYEDLKPLNEDLQSISLCGHVFHELCLQQWLEYCPRGKKSSCPVCKHQCCSQDVHRLYFQSTSESTQETFTQLPCTSDAVNTEVLRANVKKLEGQLAVAGAALESHQHHIKELDEQLSSCQHRAEKAESARAKAAKEKRNFEESLLKTQKELTMSTTECLKLREKNTALAKELAAHKLVADIDLEEEQVLRLASVGCGSNKDDVIETLRKSLILRNKSYKELMARCNLLGMGESRSLRKLGKAVEKIQRLKTRVQELERILEDKQNAAVRSLKTSERAPATSISEALYTCHKDLESENLFNEVDAGCQRPFEQIQDIGLSVQGNADSFCKLSAEGLPDFQLKTSPSNPIRDKKSSHATNEYLNGTDEKHDMGQNANLCPVFSECTTVANDFVHLDSSKRGYTDQFPIPLQFQTDILDDVDNGFVAFCDTNELDSNAINCSTDKTVTPIPTSSGERAEHNTQLRGIIDDVSFLPIKREAGRVHPGSAFTSEQPMLGVVGFNGLSRGAGKWCKQSKNSISSSGQTHNGPSSGTFIAVGADGRGGQIKVLKSPRQSLDKGLNPLWSRQPKRCKTQGVKHGTNSQGGLQIEHFFQKARQD